MPKLSTFRITKRSVDALATDRDAIYFDADLRGFAVRTKPSGSKTYLVQYEAGSRTRRISIGQHGAVTSAEARQQAGRILGRVRSGEDPAEDRAIDRKALTVRQLCDLYLKAADQKLVLGKRAQPKKASTLSVDKGRIARHILPLLGHRKVQDLTTPDINRFMRDVASGKTAVDVRTKPRGRAIVEGGRGTAARTVGLLGGMLSFAVGEGIITMNPAQGVKRPADGRRVVRLSQVQYSALGAALKQAEGVEPWQVSAAIRLLALTGCRRGEIEGLRWSEVDLAGQCFRLTDTKAGASVRPIGRVAVRILEGLPRSESPFVFPSSRTDGRFAGLPKGWSRVVRRQPDGINELTPHGLRHAFASVAHDLGLSEITIAALLGHSVASVTGRYIHTLDATLSSAADQVCNAIETMINANSIHHAEQEHEACPRPQEK